MVTSTGRERTGPPAATSVTLHGQRLGFVDAGAGPVILFVHGLLGSYRGWSHLVANLSGDYRVLAPDLFGHGASDKSVGDLSLGAHAAALRDLLDHLGVDRVTLVGHSLGGGVCLQTTYLFPERVERLVLVSSGGLGRELSPLLRVPTLPGSELVLPLVASSWVRRSGGLVNTALARAGLKGSQDAREAWRGFVQLGDADSRRAFLATARSVIDPGGQRVSAVGRLGALRVPLLLVWGGRDRMIPVAHARAAHEQVPGSRLEVFERSGHFPHLDEPDRFARVLRDFVATTPTGRRARRPRRAG
ncbi:alpha/beta fold hydrolase [Thalassiella azotivora]